MTDCEWDDPPRCEKHGGYAKDGWESVRRGEHCVTEPKKGWVVADDTTYYPSVEWFETYEKARDVFDDYTREGGGSTCYLAEVKEMGDS